MATEARTSVTGQSFRVPKTAELVAAHLRNQIVRGQLVEGDSLPPEAELMADFGVSRPTLREAFRVLESESLITIRRGARGGAKVHGISPTTAARYAGLLLQARGTTLADVYQCRIILEPAAARLLAERPTKQALGVLRKCLQEQRDVMGEAPAFPLVTAQFHEQVLGLSGNTTLGVLGGMLYEIIDLHAAASLEPGPTPLNVARKSCEAHERLVDLVEAGDADGAEEHWRSHLEEGAHAMLKGLGAKKVLDLLT